MTYHRVAPRDIFNEANFMKCIGKLTLIMHDTGLEGITFNQDDYAEFGLPMGLDEYTGGLVVHGMFVAHGKFLSIHRPINSREPWPVFIEDDDGDSIGIFTDDGELSEEFKQWLEKPNV